MKGVEVLKKIRSGNLDLTLDELKAEVDGYGQTVAHILAKKVYPQQERLILFDVVDDKQLDSVLPISTPYGWSVLHQISESGEVVHLTDYRRKLYLSLREGEFGDTPLHVLARSNPGKFLKTFSPYKDIQFYTVPNLYGDTPAHILSRLNYLEIPDTDDFLAILTSSNVNGETVAEILFLNGKRFKNPKILNLELSFLNRSIGEIQSYGERRAQ
ncbi:hypothetical protein [Desulfurobacterium sp.]|uniref:hypothetical protein n=1 Tax=Desulfurobacterium sp. TaxID=2004706 RepID=UPI002626691D|nr:hypothetical protein [Desulfurobacterium sp.]